MSSPFGIVPEAHREVGSVKEGSAGDAGAVWAQRGDGTAFAVATRRCLAVPSTQCLNVFGQYGLRDRPLSCRGAPGSVSVSGTRRLTDCVGGVIASCIS